MEYRLKLQKIKGGFLVSGLDALGGAYSEGQDEDKSLVDIKHTIEMLTAYWSQNRGLLRSTYSSPDMVITDSYD